MDNRSNYNSLIDYRGVNPLVNWRIREIENMLHQIEEYKNVHVVFQFHEADYWKKKHWDCKCGIQEGNIWILQYQFRIEDKDEADARLAAWDMMTRKLITDVWCTAIKVFRQ